MDLGDESIQGFITNQGINLLSDETFDQVLNFCVSQICENSVGKSLSQIYGSKPDAVKSSYAGITSLLIEAARQNLEKETLIAALKGTQLSELQAKKICEVYGNNKEQFREKLQTIGGGLPQLVDVNWKLDYCIQSNTTDSEGTPIYLVSLQTLKHGETKFVRFTCTLQQLQDLVHKLKDAIRHMEKMSS